MRPPAERAGLSHVLDAPLPLAVKIDLARELDTRGRSRPATRSCPTSMRRSPASRCRAADRPVVARLHEQLDEELDRGATEAFSRSFLIAALIALLAAGAAFVGARGRRRRRRRLAVLERQRRERGWRWRCRARSPPAALLVAVYLALGGGGFGPRDGRRSVRAARAPGGGRAHPARGARGARRHGLQARPAARGSPAQAARRRAAGGVSDDELVDAFGAGIDRARDERELSAVQAAALRVGLKTGGLLGIIGLLLPDE